MLKSLKIAAVVLVIGSAAPATAHHSFAMFDQGKQVQVEGKVKSFAYTNPHAWLYVDVTKDGQATTWGFELGAPTLLQRQKIFPSTFKPGDTLKIDASPMKDGRPGGSFIRAVNSTGAVIGRPVGGGGPP